MTIKQYYRRLVLERLIMKLKLASLGFCVACSLWIIGICLTSYNDTDELNKCLKTHTLDYCNNNIK